MTRYLSSIAREDAVIIAGAFGVLNGVADRWTKNMNNPPKEVIGYIRAGARFIGRGLRELDKDLDNNEVLRLRRMAKTTAFRLHYDRMDLSSKGPGVRTYDITEDEKDNLVEALAEVRCKGCDGCKKDCTVRSHFFKWDVTPIYDVTDDKHPCQYMYLEE